MTPRLWLVCWRDAHGLRGADTREHVLRSHKPAIYWTCGVLVASDDVGVTVAQDYGLPMSEGDEVTYRTRTFIPRVLIEFETDAGKLIRKARLRKEPLCLITPPAA